MGNFTRSTFCHKRKVIPLNKCSSSESRGLGSIILSIKSRIKARNLFTLANLHFLSPCSSTVCATEGTSVDSLALIPVRTWGDALRRWAFFPQEWSREINERIIKVWLLECLWEWGGIQAEWTHIMEMCSQETLLSNQEQSRLVIEDNLCVRPGREAFVCTRSWWLNLFHTKNGFKRWGKCGGTMGTA